MRLFHRKPKIQPEQPLGAAIIIVHHDGTAVVEAEDRQIIVPRRMNRECTAYDLTALPRIRILAVIDLRTGQAQVLTAGHAVWTVHGTLTLCPPDAEFPHYDGTGGESVTYGMGDEL